MKQVKGGTKNLTIMKNSVKHVMRGEVIENWNDLVVNCWSPRKVMNLYRDFSLFFAFPCLPYDKRRRYDKFSGKTHYNILIKKEGTLYVDQ